MIETQTFLDSNTLTCFMDKELVWQNKFVLMEKKNILMLVEVNNG
jgi:hypothetical protein